MRQRLCVIFALRLYPLRGMVSLLGYAVWQPCCLGKTHPGHWVTDEKEVWAGDTGAVPCPHISLTWSLCLPICVRPLRIRHQALYETIARRQGIARPYRCGNFCEKQNDFVKKILGLESGDHYRPVLLLILHGGPWGYLQMPHSPLSGPLLVSPSPCIWVWL